MKRLRNGFNGRRRKRRRRLQRVSFLPALMTLINLICGFAAIHFAAKSVIQQQFDTINPEPRSRTLRAVAPPTLAAAACYLIFAAMLADSLDGSLARLTRSANEFGGQLDSLADVISFGAAPAFIAISLVQRYSLQDMDWAPGPLSDRLAGRIAWLMAASFLACAALRLARFNVENSPDDDAHLSFRGLPSPAAAGTLAALVILHEQNVDNNLPAVSTFLIKALPLAAFVLGLLMVSRFPYPHVVNRYMRGRQPFQHLVRAIGVIAAILVFQEFFLVISLLTYAAWGPVSSLIARFSPTKKPASAGTVQTGPSDDLTADSSIEPTTPSLDD
jgi:CDP-diacylglycerol--serine O-phosphatidyltransferase